jgi:hypothetical protein
MGFREQYPIARAVIVGAWILALVPVGAVLWRLPPHASRVITPASPARRARAALSLQTVIS